MKLFVISAWNKAIRGVARARNIAIQPGKIGIPFGHLIDKPGQDTLDAPSWLYGVIWRAKEPIGMLPASTATIPALPIPLHFVAEKRPRAFVLFQHRLDRRVFGQLLNIQWTHTLLALFWFSGIYLANFEFNEFHAFFCTHLFPLRGCRRQLRNNISALFEVTVPLRLNGSRDWTAVNGWVKKKSTYLNTWKIQMPGTINDPEIVPVAHLVPSLFSKV